ncbi:hypothetical protein GZH47_01675 [Paenibacillus rhizovicinus]|uniref:DNA mismatch repair proteins mutS family domain-containing protein n=1 Tax=Paenibacillus rhizovicinus TaxID=2704463 RepID=A0A6C0NYW9_9BACL|nr:hypothetical protein [Paenibacillus rhizovicinus]QHW29672.1 hypothetical protein GZH47_01675 [Paenibacillus rhizovicinus]
MLRLFRIALHNDVPFPMSKTLLDDVELTAYLGRYFVNPSQYITSDPESIRERNAVCEALTDNDALTASLHRLHNASLPLLETASSVESEPIHMIGNMIGVRQFRDAAQAVIQTIGTCGQLPASLAELPAKLTILLEESYPHNFDEAWNKYASGVGKTGSLAYRIHFSDDLTIYAIALHDVNRKRYVSSTLLNRLINTENPMRVDELLPLAYQLGKRFSHVEATALERFSHSVQQMLIAQTAIARNQLNVVERSIADEIRVFVEELQFALGMVQYAKASAKHAPCTCYAEIRGAEERSLIIRKMVHPLLAEQADVIANDIAIQDGREFVLLGGVNRGGKTTFLRTAGAIQLLFQMGLPIPAASAQISPASGMYSVFSREENTELSQGTLGRELCEMRDVIAALDENCLFLGNEPISGTSPMESYLLSRETLCMLKAKQARGIWVTHLYELFDDIGQLNGIPFGSKFDCMHTEAVDGDRSYSIRPGIPRKYSGAREVFSSYSFI